MQITQVAEEGRPADPAVSALLAENEALRAEIARLKARLTEAETMADRDALTPLFNRRAFLRELHRVQTGVRRYGQPAALVYFDLDELKAINDRLGHAAGDSVLHGVAERLAQGIRGSDLAARIGGDEFAVILVRATVDQATARAEALAGAIAAELAVDLSWGVAEITPDAAPEAVLATADAAMYAHKQSRR